MGTVLHLFKIFLEKKKYGVPPTIAIQSGFGYDLASSRLWVI